MARLFSFWGMEKESLLREAGKPSVIPIHHQAPSAVILLRRYRLRIPRGANQPFISVTLKKDAARIVKAAKVRLEG